MTSTFVNSLRAPDLSSSFANFVLTFPFQSAIALATAFKFSCLTYFAFHATPPASSRQHSATSHLLCSCQSAGQRTKVPFCPVSLGHGWGKMFISPQVLTDCGGVKWTRTTEPNWLRRSVVHCPQVLADCGGVKWTRTTDLALIRRVL